MKKTVEFTGKEVEILQLVSDGFTNPEIAELLVITEKSVINYKKTIVRKAGVHTLDVVVKTAQASGFLNSFPEELKKYKEEYLFATDAIRNHDPISGTDNLFMSVLKKFSGAGNIFTRKIFRKAALLILLAGLNLFAPSSSGKARFTSGKAIMHANKTSVKSEQEQLNTVMHKLWEDHITLTRNVVQCIVNDNTGIDEAAHQLVQNQVDMGNVLKAYYGAKAGKAFTALLYQNITIAADEIIAVRNGRINHERTDQKWRQSNNNIVAFLSAVNFYWDRDEMQKLMDDEMEFIAREAQAIKNKDNDGGTRAYEYAMSNASVTANYFSEGIIKQFPEKFREYTNSLGQK